MSITMPVLDLGELGAALEAEIRADDNIVVEQEALPEATAADAPTGEVAGPAAETPPAAEAAAAQEADQDADAAYRARFEAEYAERSRGDLSKLRSSLDRQITKWRSEAGDRAHELEETEHYVGFLERQLGEYDPDAVAKFRHNREGHRERRARDRQTAQREFEARRVYREHAFREMYPGLDPYDPEIYEAFVEGNQKLEVALIRQRRAELAATRAARQPATPSAPVAEPKATPPRGEDGRFVARAEETRKVEAARGAETIASGRGGGFPETPATTFEAARAQLQKGFARMGLN